MFRLFIKPLQAVTIKYFNIQLAMKNVNEISYFEDFVNFILKPFKLQPEDGFRNSRNMSLL